MQGIKIDLEPAPITRWIERFLIITNIHPKPFRVPFGILMNTDNKEPCACTETHSYDNHRRNVECLIMKAIFHRPGGIDLCAHPLQILQSFCGSFNGWLWSSRSCIQLSSNNIVRQTKERGLNPGLGALGIEARACLRRVMRNHLQVLSEVLNGILLGWSAEALVSTTKSKKSRCDHYGRNRAEGHRGNASTVARLGITINHLGHRMSLFRVYCSTIRKLRRLPALEKLLRPLQDAIPSVSPFSHRTAQRPLAYP